MAFTFGRNKMESPQAVYHLVTRKRFHLNQALEFNDQTKNRLHDFFIDREIRNQKGEDFYQILDKSRSETGIHINKEDSETIFKYAGITSRSIRETILEMVRLRNYASSPSRLNCLYAARNYDEVSKWKSIFESYDREILQVVKLSFDGRYFEGDGSLIPELDGCSFSTKINQAEKYWKGGPDCKLPEVLIDGKITVIEIVDDFEVRPPK